MTKAMPSLANITWERLERENSVTYPCDAPDQPGHEIVFGNGFPTETGAAGWCRRRSSRRRRSRTRNTRWC